MTDRAQLTRLILQIERDVLARAQLKTLVTDADATIAGRRRDLRNLKTRMARLAPGPGRPE
jgi:predicted HAD superfamily phosphohydrolase YqeG